MAKSATTKKPSRKKERSSTTRTSPGSLPKPTKPSALSKDQERWKKEPRLQTIQRIVEEQPTEAFQALLFSLAEKNLKTLMRTHKKVQGVRKFSANANYIPNSLRNFGPEIGIHPSLQEDPDSLEELTGWKDDLLTCKQMLAKRIERQSNR